MTPARATPGIRRLDPSTVAKIAAGEVVERPAAVVKELVENAIDAGAREVTVRLEGGGLESIVVEDDGDGIPAMELPLAVERYATSKLAPTAEVEAIGTLGFRGEALAAIATVARLRLISRPRDDEVAHGVSVVGGAVVGAFELARAPGTTVEVHDLFFNTPARRKFMHAPAAEQVEVASTLERLYLARPEVGVTLVVGHRESARYPPTTSLRDAASHVLGTPFYDQSVAVDLPSRGGVEVRGVLARPVLSRSTAHGIFLAVNGRSVQSRALVQAVRQAYLDYLPRTRFPIAVLHLAIDLERVDVNVHPTKREVRIAKEREVADTVRRAVREALLRAPQVADRPTAVPTIEHLPPPAPTEGPSSSTGARALEPPSLAVSLAAIPAGRQTRLFPVEGRRTLAATERHPALELIGSVFDLYWVAQSDEHLVLVDQHAASERVLFEEIRTHGGLARQELMTPVQVELTARQEAVLTSRHEEIRLAGFDVEPFGGGSHRVRAVPVYRGHLARPQSLPALLDELADGGRPTVPDGLTERVAATIACHAAVRAGDVISAEEMGRILESLYALPDAAYACPHGRPILVRFGLGQLERWFLRSGR
ncbi:MAG: DNA mismatch repair endonuclease MutL [Thermoplasmata archaeon]